MDTPSVSLNKPKVLVTQPYIPKLEKYVKYIERAFNNKWLTNNGPLLQELTDRLKDKLQVKYLLLVNNGTSALQVAYRIKNLANKQVITTPFTFPATSTALDWQSSKVALADIDSKSWNLCPNAVENRLKQSKVDAIVPVNIFGAPCDLDAFEILRNKYQLPIIYDSAQAMLSQYKGKNIFSYGDIHCISFHATKLFHCVEGGALVFNNKDDFERATHLINFGIDNTGCVKESGINAKMSELHAAMGLSLLDDLPDLVKNRADSVELYKAELNQVVEFQSTTYDAYIPPMYMPVKFQSERELLRAEHALHQAGFLSRRYFHPEYNGHISANLLAPLSKCNQICSSILCLPLMHDLAAEHIKAMAKVIMDANK